MLNDTDEWQIMCASCGNKTQKQIGWLRVHDSLICSGCNANLETDAALKTIDNLKNTVRQLHGTALLLKK